MKESEKIEIRLKEGFGAMSFPAMKGEGDMIIQEAFRLEANKSFVVAKEYYDKFCSHYVKAGRISTIETSGFVNQNKQLRNELEEAKKSIEELTLNKQNIKKENIDLSKQLEEAKKSIEELNIKLKGLEKQLTEKKA